MLEQKPPRINDVEMDGRKYDFILVDNVLKYRQSNHLGGTFAVISDSPRYKSSVRRVVRQVLSQLTK